VVGEKIRSMSNDGWQNGGGYTASATIEKGTRKRTRSRAVWPRRNSPFGLRLSFVIRISSFVIPCLAISCPLQTSKNHFASSRRYAKVSLLA